MVLLSLSLLTVNNKKNPMHDVYNMSVTMLFIFAGCLSTSFFNTTSQKGDGAVREKEVGIKRG